MKHRCLAYGHMAAVHRWQLRQGAEVVAVQIASALCSNNGEVLRTSALAGNGIAILPTFFVGPDIGAGRLVQVLADNPPPELGIFALYAPNRYLAAKTRVFIDFLVLALRRGAGAGTPSGTLRAADATPPSAVATSARASARRHRVPQ